MSIESRKLDEDLAIAKQMWDSVLDKWTRAEGALAKAKAEVQRYELRCERSKAEAQQRAEKWVKITNQIAGIHEIVKGA